MIDIVCAASAVKKCKCSIEMEASVNIVLLSGGSGKRLWPLSNEIRSKQFIKIFKNEDCEYESMVQRVYRQIRAVEQDAAVTIATSKSQVSAIHNQLGEEVSICVEPCRRDTFPAIALAASYLHDRKGVREEESVVVCPVDPYVEEAYFEALKKLGERAAESDANLVLMGIEPTYPSAKYGYIIPEHNANISLVKTFKEKPDEVTAKHYIEQGALWNGGVFAFRLGYVLKKAHKLIDFEDYEDLYSKYETLTKISFDYAVVEKEDAIEVMRFDGQWKDLGTWNTLTEAMDSANVGEAIFNDSCENVHVVNELNVPILCMGLKDLVISASPDGILVSDKTQSSYIKPYVDAINQQIMFAEKSWGSFRVLSIEEESMTIIVKLNTGHSMNYHSHERRDEVWTVISGMGRTIIDGIEQTVSAGDVVTMPAGCRHTIIADTELHVIEVQLGKEINVHDKRKYRLEGLAIIHSMQSHGDSAGIAYC
jgi:mannose-1-phosphate guanylyltransferase